MRGREQVREEDGRRRGAAVEAAARAHLRCSARAMAGEARVLLDLGEERNGESGLRLPPTVPCIWPPTPRRGSFGGKSDPTVPPKAPPIYGGS